MERKNGSLAGTTNRNGNGKTKTSARLMYLLHATPADSADSTTAKQALMVRYLPLVRNVAGRMALGFPKSVELDDLISAGIFGLIDAFKKFDADRGVKFETFAVPRIRGAILDELRSLDWVPRSVRTKERELERSTARLGNCLGRVPAQVEIAEDLGWGMDVFHSAMDDISGAGLLSADELVFRPEEDRQIPRIETIMDPGCNGGTEEKIDAERMKQRLSEAMTGLPEQTRQVLCMYYLEGLTLGEIGETMDLSESRISQIHTKGVAALRCMLGLPPQPRNGRRTADRVNTRSGRRLKLAGHRS